MQGTAGSPSSTATAILRLPPRPVNVRLTPEPFFRLAHLNRNRKASAVRAILCRALLGARCSLSASISCVSGCPCLVTKYSRRSFSLVSTAAVRAEDRLR